MKKKQTKKNPAEALISLALKEDIDKGDITTNIFVPANAISKAHIVAHQKATISGLDVVKKIFTKLDKTASVRTFVKDGQTVKPETILMEVRGKTRALLTGERVALNFLSHLSGVATNTHQFLKAIKPYNVKIADTRKTTPGMRLLEKQAVRQAKGTNHRFSLNDMVLIKDNHHLICPYLSITQMIQKSKRATSKPICVEIENFKNFKEAWKARPKIILLDNMTTSQIKRIVAFTKTNKISKAPELEVSGGIILKNIKSYAKTGIQRISIGALTHTKKNINISMKITP